MELRPEYLPVTLTAGGEKTVYSTVAQSNGTDTWYVEFSGFPKYDASGEVIDYGITAPHTASGIYGSLYFRGTDSGAADGYRGSKGKNHLG